MFNLNVYLKYLVIGKKFDGLLFSCFHMLSPVEELFHHNAVVDLRIVILAMLLASWGKKNAAW